MNTFRILFAAIFLLLAPRVIAVPNVIVIVVDDLSQHDAYTAADLVRPNIDSLSANGVRFTNGYATAPVCSPSRAGLMTGRYQQKFGHETNPGLDLEHHPRFGLPTTETTMGERFKALNFATGWIGKSHLGSQPDYHPNVRGFDHFYGFLESHHFYVEANNPAKVTMLMPYEPIQRNGTFIPEMDGTPTSPPSLEYLTFSFARDAVDFIGAHNAEPFFLYLPFNAVHFTLEHTNDTMNPGDALLSTRTAGLGHVAGSQRQLMAETLLGLDDAIGAILAKLRTYPDPEHPNNPTRTLENNTIIFFTSDNGGDELFGANNGDLLGRKTTLYEGGIRVPFVVQWKGHIAPAERTASVSTLDILPTAMAAVGVTPPAAWQLDGVNLLPYMQNAASVPARTDLFWRVETDGIAAVGNGVDDGLRAMRRGNWKLVKPGTTKTWELYDLGTDGIEDDNVADANPAVLAEMIAAYEAWNAQLATPRWSVDDLQFPGPDFVLEDVRVGSSMNSYLAPDFSPIAAEFAFQDGAALMRDGFDLLTGFPALAPVTVDTGLAPLTSGVAGPQWGVSAAGASLFYTKPASMQNQVWRALPGAAMSLTTDPAGSFGARVSQDAADAAVKMVFTAGTTAFWATDAPPVTVSVIPTPAAGAENGRWIPGTADLVYVNASGQIARLVTATNTSVAISNDVGPKSDAWAYYAPEFDGELCYAALVNRESIAIYRDLHDGPTFTRVTTLTLPPGSPPRFLYSMRPVEGLRGFNGTSWFTCASFANDDPQNPGASEILLFGVGPDSAHRIVRRLDDGTGAARSQPRTVIGEREVFCYYTRNDGVNPAELRLAATGLSRPDFKGVSGFASLKYSAEPTAGTNTPLGTAMHGTETTHFVTHGGKLFAAQGSAGSPAVPLGPNWSGAQILVRDSATADWELDEDFPGHERVEAMDEFTFTRSGLAPLTLSPRTVLVAALSDFGSVGSNIASVRLRKPGDWADSHPNNGSAAFVGSFGFHVDDGVTPSGENLFAGLSNGEIHRADFVAGGGGNFDWAANPELTGTGPVTSFAEANGVLYAACGLRQDVAGGPVTGGLYRRVDGADAWTLVWRWPGPAPLHTAPESQRVMTGLTAVPDPRGTENQVLIGARSWPGVIERIDPANDHAVTVELDVRDFFARRWADDSVRSQDVRVGYTRFTRANDPVTGEEVHLIGVWSDRPGSGASHILIRHRNATYEAASIPDDDPQPGQTLRGTRTIAVSPFAADGGAAFFFGGYDAADDEMADTAWIQRGEWTALPQLTITRPNAPQFQLTWPPTNLDWVLEATPSLAPANWQSVPTKPVRSVQSTTLSVPTLTPSAFFRLRRQ